MVHREQSIAQHQLIIGFREKEAKMRKLKKLKDTEVSAAIPPDYRADYRAASLLRL